MGGSKSFGEAKNPENRPGFSPLAGRNYEKYSHVVQPLHFFGPFPIMVANLAFPFIQREPLQGQKRPDHVFSHPLGLVSGLGPDAAVNTETRVLPGEEAVEVMKEHPRVPRRGWAEMIRKVYEVN
jgi:hypothetical protein